MTPLTQFETHTTPKTSRLITNPERGVLPILRAVAPRRRLSPVEAAYVAELQAVRLLELAGLTHGPVPTSLIADLPRVDLRYDVDLPVSGTTHWQNGRWIITVNASEPLPRQRFTICHELKHAIDHRHHDVLYRSTPGQSAEVAAELAADTFAACLLMPKRWVKRAWNDGHQRISDLADLFSVSPQAMRRRLEHLGLEPRIGAGDQRHDGHRRIWYRRLRRSIGGLIS